MSEKILQQKIYGSNEVYTQYENGLGDIAKKGIDAEGLLFEEHNTGDRFVWDDLRFPLVGRSIDVSSGRLDYDFFNGGVKFEDNARYPNEPISFMVQLPHAWVEGSELRPHIHWLQQSANVPNWLLAYKKYKKGELTTLEILKKNTITQVILAVIIIIIASIFNAYIVAFSVLILLSLYIASWLVTALIFYVQNKFKKK